MRHAESLAIVEQMFHVYVETQSDFAVRNWLKERQIPSASGKSTWGVSSIREVLLNRRYIGQIEINKRSKGLAHVSATDEYQIAQASHGPLVPVELFEVAEAIREEKAARHPNNPGSKRGWSRDYGQNKSGRVSVLQGILQCAHCGHPVSPHYTEHKAGHHRRSTSYISYYTCAKAKREGKNCDHKNRVLARIAESWVMETMMNLAASPDMTRRAFESARQNYAQESKPIQDALALTKAGLHENQKQTSQIVETIASGKADDALMEILNERARDLRAARQNLEREQRRLVETLLPVDEHFDGGAFLSALSDFKALAEAAEPKELQRLLRLLIESVGWGPDGAQEVLFYPLPDTNLLEAKQPAPNGTGWYDTNVQKDSSNWIRTSNPPINSRMLHR